MSLDDRGSLSSFSVIGRDVKWSGKWLRAVEVMYMQPDGKPAFWESVERTTRHEGYEVDGVDILTLISHGSPDVPAGSDRPAISLKRAQVALAIQPRPAVGRLSVEFPAGLIDRGETVAGAAERELSEETGLTGDILEHSPPLALDPGMSNSSTSIVSILVDGDSEENRNAKQNLDSGEFINVVRAPLLTLRQSLQDYTARGFAVDAKLYAFALGLEWGGQLAAPTPGGPEEEEREKKPLKRRKRRELWNRAATITNLVLLTANLGFLGARIYSYVKSKRVKSSMD
eukprot:124010_1